MRILAGVALLSAVTVWSDSGHNSRRPSDDAELRYWLENMVVFHRFTPEEVAAATGLTTSEVAAAVAKFHLQNHRPPPPKRNEPLRVLPYPGGRHPRIGFLDGAIDPQRETKISVFTPWDRRDYVVVDVPEAIWSNLGLTYLAHTHVKTIWDLQSVQLPKLEWRREPNGVLVMERTLPNQIGFGTRVTPQCDGVRFDLWLTNGTPEKLTGLRVQNCVMLKMAAAVCRDQIESKEPLDYHRFRSLSDAVGQPAGSMCPCRPAVRGLRTRRDHAHSRLAVVLRG